MYEQTRGTRSAAWGTKRVQKEISRHERPVFDGQSHDKELEETENQSQHGMDRLLKRLWHCATQLDAGITQVSRCSWN